MIYIIGILVLVTGIYFCSIVWIILGFIKVEKSNQFQLDKNNERKISIIIPARNEENSILNCIKSLQNQNYNCKNFEVIIVNDHSTDNTQKIVNDFITTCKLDIQLVSLTEKTTKKEALKLGIAQSKYKVISTTDADCILPKNWLSNISLHLSDDVDMLLGPVMFKKKKGFLPAFQMLDMLAIQGMEFGALNYQKPILNNAANLTYSKNIYNEVNGFDSFNTPSGDDIFLLEKFKSKNQKIKGVLTEDFIVETKSESTFIGFIYQRLRWSSKSKYYSDKLLIYFSSILLIQCVSFIFICLGFVLVEKYTLMLTILLLSKWLIDFILLFLVASFFKRRKTLFYFIPVQIIYPIYVILIWVASMTLKFEWKGRKF